MKIITKTIFACALTLGTLSPALAQTVPSPYDAQLSLAPVGGAQMTPGATLTLDLNISQLQASPDEPQALGSYNIVVDYNPSIVNALSGSIIDTLGTKSLNVDANGDFPSVTLSSGQITLNDVSFGSVSALLGQSKSFTLATLTFQDLTSGAATSTSPATIDLSSTLGDQNGNGIAYAVVPEPSSVLLSLMGVSILAFVAVRRRMSI